MKSIPELMIEEHERLNQILKQVEEKIDTNIKEAEMTFNKFKWNLEKHFFVEEKVIFTLYETENQEDRENVFYLLKEHKDILWVVKELSDNFIGDVKPKILKIKEIIINHEKIEDDVFYPRLEEELNQEQKQLITQRSEDIIIG